MSFRDKGQSAIHQHKKKKPQSRPRGRFSTPTAGGTISYLRPQQIRLICLYIIHEVSKSRTLVFHSPSGRTFNGFYRIPIIKVFFFSYPKMFQVRSQEKYYTVPSLISCVVPSGVNVHYNTKLLIIVFYLISSAVVTKPVPEDLPR